MVKNTTAESTRFRLHFPAKCCIIHSRYPAYAESKVPGVAQLVGRLVWDQDAASSSLATRTKIPAITFVVAGILFSSESGDFAMIKKIKEFIAKETVLCVAALCAALTMLLVPPDREYLHYIDFRVLCLLLCLMAVVAGLKAIGTFQLIIHQAHSLLKSMFLIQHFLHK